MSTTADYVFYALILLSMLIVVCACHDRWCGCRYKWSTCESFLVAMGAMGLITFMGLAGLVYMAAKGLPA